MRASDPKKGSVTMDTIELPLSKPPIIGYLHHAYPLSIMSACDNYLPWLHSNYIQLYCYKDFNDSACPLNFYLYQYNDNYPLLDMVSLTRTIVDSICDIEIVQFIKNCIDNGYHFIAYVDEFYV